MPSPDHARWIRAAVAISAIALGSCASDAGPRYASEFLLVNVDPATPATAQLAVQACAGLENRRLGGSVYVQTEANDAQWLADLGLVPSRTVTADEFLQACATEFPRCVRYSYATQQALLPNILTVGAALSALPLDENLAVTCGRVAFDARVEFATANTPDLATRYVLDHYLDRTTGLAMLNPGYDVSPSDPSSPAINRDMPGALVDFVFSQRLFTVFLVNGCDGLSADNTVLHDVVNSGHFPTPLGVYGYNNSWLIGGYLHEAQTRCLASRNMGAIPTETGNLSFFSTRRAAIADPAELSPPAPEQVTYDPTKTYVAFVVGDGDNVRFIMTSRRAWLAERVAACADPTNVCAPLTWSISPHLAELAPDVLRWYFDTSRTTGNDYFILPPSGHLYAYPSSMGAADQDRFVAATERDARILGAHGTVHWDVNATWRDAEDVFLPKYAHAGGVIKAIVPVNVPYVYPAFPWWSPSEFYRVLTGDDDTPMVVFRPREWRGVDDADAEFHPSPATMAAELAGYPAGTVTVIYMTSDGGLSLSNSFVELVKILPANVQVVSVDAAARLALAASGR